MTARITQLLSTRLFVRLPVGIYPALLRLFTVHSASSASILNEHCRQQGPSRSPEHFSVAGLWPQIEQWYIPGWLSITSNVTGDFGMAALPVLFEQADACRRDCYTFLGLRHGRQHFRS